MNNNEIIRDVTYNENVMNNDPFIRDFVTLNKSVINYLPRCSYHLLYFDLSFKCITVSALKINQTLKLTLCRSFLKIYNVKMKTRWIQ